MSAKNFRADRLRLLAKKLRSLTRAQAKYHFDMNAWFDHDEEADGHEHPVPARPTSKDLLTCGTTACALGWATTIPALQKAGLRMGLYFEGSSVHIPVYRGVSGVEAAAKLFGIYHDVAQYLFGGDDFARTPKQVAKAIDKIIACKGEAFNLPKSDW